MAQNLNRLHKITHISSKVVQIFIYDYCMHLDYPYFVLLSGEDEFFARKALKEYKQIALNTDKDFTFSNIDAGAYSSGDIFTLSSASLFSQSENIFLFVDNVQNANDIFYQDCTTWITAIDRTPKLDNKTQNSNGLNILAVFWHKKGNGGKKIVNTLKKQHNFREIICKPLTASNSISFIHSYSRKADFNISNQTAEYIAGSLGQDASAIAGFIDHMSFLMHMEQYKAHNTAQKTYTVVSSYLEYDCCAAVYKISNAILNLKRSKALMLTRKYIDSGQNLILLQTILMTEFTKLAKSGKNNALWTDQKIKKSIFALAELDLLLKGKTKAVKFALERTVQNILADN